MFVVLHLTMVRRGFESGAAAFYEEFSPLFMN
jgi:hypothetical protein